MSIGLLRAEWTKIRSVQSTIWSMAAFVIGVIGFSTLVAAVINNPWKNTGSHSGPAKLLSKPPSVLFGAGLGLGQFAICVLGVLVISSEYTTGAIRSSLLAVPRRIPMLAATATVWASMDFVLRP